PRRWIRRAVRAAGGRVRETVITIGVCAVAAAGALLLVLRRRYLVVTIDGHSMEPTYPFDIPGVPRETIVRVRPDDRLFLKRLVARPGDPVPRASVPPLRDVPEPVVP